MKTVAALALATGLTLSACAYTDPVIESARNYSVEGAAAAIEANCKLSPSVRQKNLDALNAKLADRGLPPQVLLNCP